MIDPGLPVWELHHQPDGDLLDPWLAALPDIPGIYLILVPGGRPLLARTAFLRRALLRLFGARERASKLLHLRGLACTVQCWPTASRLEALLLRYTLAQQYLGADWQDALRLRWPTYVRLTRSTQFARAMLTTRPTPGDAACVGPFRSRTGAERCEAAMLDLFQLRRCQEELTPSPEHPGCMYGEMGRCLRPCQGAVSPEEYRREARRVGEFLQTAGQSLLEPLTVQRQAAAEALEFEEAARIHEQVERVQAALQWRDELARPLDRQHGVAVTLSIEPGTVLLWRLHDGCWVQRFPFTPAGDETLEAQLRRVWPGEPEVCDVTQQPVSLALLAAWGYSSFRDGEWVVVDDETAPPWRKLANAVKRLLVPQGSRAAGSDAQ